MTSLAVRSPSRALLVLTAAVSRVPAPAAFSSGALSWALLVRTTTVGRAGAVTALTEYFIILPLKTLQNYSGQISTHVKERSRGRSDVIWATSKLRGGTAPVAISTVLRVNLVRATPVVRVSTPGGDIDLASFLFSFLNSVGVRLNKANQF